MPVFDPSTLARPLDVPNPESGETFTHWIGQRVVSHGDRPAVVYVDDDGEEQTWTYAELWNRACAVAGRLPATDEASPRGLLLFPPGIEFLAGFLGCQIAGWVPVPTSYPKPGRPMSRLDSVASDCAPAEIIGDRETLDAIAVEKLCDQARSLPLVASNDPLPFGAAKRFELPSPNPESLALLQYTSGSTSEPKGVMVRHRNLMANLEAIRQGFHIDWQSDEDGLTPCGVFWLPFFHDMGLIGGILTPLYVGGCTVLMSPRAFLQRPLRWLQAIDDYQAVISGAPNFAYQLCVDRIAPDQTDGLDLRCWKTAFCGAEPVLARTLLDFASRFSSCGFDEASFYPCYGLAEATLLAAGGDGPAKPEFLTVVREALRQGRAEINEQGRGRDVQKLVSCGQPALATELVIVDPERCHTVGDRVIGEIWLRGESITDGYWNRDEENREQFNARLSDGGAGYCRTGDLGFLHHGSLYVTGRRKDVIILRGRNHFPQDIEATVRVVIGDDAGQVAAFSVEGPRSEALAIIAEVPRQTRESDLPDLVRSIRRVVIEDHEVDPRHVILVRPATVPLTSSGKIQRGRCRELFDAGGIRHRHRYDRASGSEQTPIALPNLPNSPSPADFDAIASAVEGWLSEWLIVRAGVAPEDVDFEKPFSEYGLDSMTAVELSGELEDWSGVELTPVIAMTYPSVAEMGGYIAEEMVGAPGIATPRKAVPQQSPNLSL